MTTEKDKFEVGDDVYSIYFDPMEIKKLRIIDVEFLPMDIPFYHLSDGRTGMNYSLFPTKEECIKAAKLALTRYRYLNATENIFE